jgi:uncharacterized protein with ParB-like and HNH nuclease domain
MKPTLELKTVNELCDYKFLVPSYQRGYRWNEEQVLDLLNDINEFSPRDTDVAGEKTWYCLQPIVVKKDHDYFEVIDGQQRLTTIYLILHRMNARMQKSEWQDVFKLKYSTRDHIENFLDELVCDKSSDENIDYYYITRAYKVICDFFKDKSINVREFESNFGFYTKVIWYETTETNPITIFTRINMGKIPLTNAELIKADL